MMNTELMTANTTANSVVSVAAAMRNCDLMEELRATMPYMERIQEQTQAYYTMKNRYESIHKIGGGWIVLGLIFYIIPGLIMLVINASRRDEMEELEGKMAKCLEKLRAIQMECPTLMPKECLYPREFEYLCELATSGRAATLPEALDKLEQQEHRWKLEEQNDTMLAKQDIANALLKETAERVRWSY